MMWATPGPYLRQLMPKTLAKKASDYYLPEVFYETTTFTETVGSPSRPPEEEETLSVSLNLRMKQEDEEREKKMEAEKMKEEAEEEAEEEGEESE